MRRHVLLFLLAVGGCSRQAGSIPNRFLDSDDRALRDRNGILERDGVPFSGYLVQRDGAQLLLKTGYRNGKRHGPAQAWYKDGSLSYLRHFQDGSREGTHRGWWPNGNLQFVYRYEHDIFEGEQVGYYKNGVRAELRHFRSGYEEGQQTSWDGTGRISANYTFKAGRRYGIVGRFDCTSVH